MLPGLGIQEIILLGVLALVVVGPKDLPLLLRKLGRWTAKLRGMANEFRSGFDELARQAELDELKKEVQALRNTTSLTEIGRELNKPLPTLEDYAGISRPPPPLPAPVADAAPVEPPAPAGEAATPDPEAIADQVETRESVGLDVPEHADVAPIKRSGP